MNVKSNVVRLSGQAFDLNEHTLIFTHIPKCGGTSLHKTLEHLLGINRYRVFVGKPNPSENLDQLRGGGGHQRFGNNALHLYAQRKSIVYTTVLREPFEQFKSWYMHLKRDRVHNLRLRFPGIEQCTPIEILDYLDKIDNRSARNLQSLMVSPGARSIDDLIEHVRENYTVVGALDEFDLYLDSISGLFGGWEIRKFDLNKKTTGLNYLKQSMASSGDDREIFDEPDLRERFYEQNEMDLALYHHFKSSIQSAGK